MNDLLRQATVELARFLRSALPRISPEWWGKNVLARLTFSQQRAAKERGLTGLEQLDFAACLRVLDQNWFELSNLVPLPREGRTWVKELQTVRNKWAHLPAEGMPPSEFYRDTDTLERLLKMLGAEGELMTAIAEAKRNALASITPPSAPPQPPPSIPGQPPAGAMPPLFRVGDLVALRSDTSRVMAVLEVLPDGAECRYRAFHGNAVATYYQSQLQVAKSADKARVSLEISDLHACLTALQILSPSTTNLFSLRSGRVKFVPYQYRPVLKLIRADQPRLLVADEVGVGKTIEAGLIIKELRARMEVRSILVICPKALVAERKWFNEMMRFDERFTALDGPRLRDCLREMHLEGEWPSQYDKILLPFSLFDSDLVFGRKGSPGLLALDPAPKFDLVIVDEAHHIRNSETILHQCVRYLCDNAQAVVLLTATPVQMGSHDLFTLLNVLRPDLVIDKASFEQMAEPNGHINAAIRSARTAGPAWQAEAIQALEEAVATEWGRAFLRESPTYQSIVDQLREPELDGAARVALVRAVEELYTFAPLINRTRRRDIGDFTTRKPETLTVEFNEPQRRLHDDLLKVIAKILARSHGAQNVKFLMTTIRRQAASCLYGLAPLLSGILTGKLDRLEFMESAETDEDLDLSFVDELRGDVQSILDQARRLDPTDPKVAAFLKVLVAKSRMPKNKALVFSTFRHTLAYLDRHARAAGLRIGLVHGAVPDEERAALRRRFALPSDDPAALDMLFSSEVGSEGLDFAFCDLLINYDLPWNPMRIEQRIGRIDRYGQESEAVAIVNLVTPGTVDAEIYDRCLWRIGVFQHAVGGNEEILGQISREVHEIAESFSLSPEERSRRLQQIADNSIRQLREEQDLEQKQAELFGLNVPGPSWRDEIKAAEAFWLSAAAIEGAVNAYLRQRLGGTSDHLLGDKATKTLRLSQEGRGLLLADYRRLPKSVEPTPREWERWLKGQQPALAVTFDQATASQDPKVVHLTVGHPLVRQAAKHLEMTEPAYFSCRASGADLPRGNHHFAIYRWLKHGLRLDETLTVVAQNADLEKTLWSLLQGAIDPSTGPLPTAADCEALDARHHALWSAAQADHIAANRQLVEYRVQSLTISQRARRRALEEQTARATNEKIRIMKASELARADADFDRRMAELQDLANSGDIRATPVLFGCVEVVG